jgi:sporulation protein YlmC with PRC-barrel domain
LAGEIIICNKPYIRYGKECCLDSNANAVCDSDEIEEEIKEGEEMPAPGLTANAFWQKTIETFKSVSSSLGVVIVPLLAILLLILIALAIKKLFEKISCKFRSKLTNKLKSTIGLKVYGSNGKIIGKVEEVYLEDYKISGWMVKLEKKTAKTFGIKNVLIKHQHVYSIGEVMILDKFSSEHLSNEEVSEHFDNANKPMKKNKKAKL